ncbi:ferredoxin--NADP reductase [Elioraea tepidiphila]|jgi:ferredoxin--NADP+ reductase|uniref:ferredoxin--NADP reductase n=1 Tax=Elioraea tepidiphila TaxID=457934 RepID=UPI000361E30A|nr:ferredoxin--NADP reductase [Elioraea tepidiphila]
MTTDVAAKPKPAGNLNVETVLTVRHWTDTLFSLTTTRDPAFRFENGEFTMIGIPVDGKPLLRAYSMVSANYEEQLEFLSIKVPDGPLTSRLQHIRPGDGLYVGRKPTGTLVVSYLVPGRTLFLLSTGTGIAPFMSIIKDPETYARFDRVVLTHTCRFERELAYRDWITRELPEHEFLGEEVRAKLVYYPTVTREPFHRHGRITQFIEDGTLFTDLGRGGFDPAEDRIMICGGPDMLAECRAIAEREGFVEGSSGTPGTYVIEKAFVEK